MTVGRPDAITARDLLHGFLELRGLSPDLDQWTEEQLADNPPRLIRLRRLMALFRAFHIPWDPRAFIEGRFIRPDDPRNADTIAKIEREEPRVLALGDPIDGLELQRCFELLFRYRERVERTLSFSHEISEASGLFLYAYLKANALNEVIRTRVVEIDDMLASLIDPDAREFRVDQLARDHGYPEDNLGEVDADWW